MPCPLVHVPGIPQTGGDGPGSLVGTGGHGTVVATAGVAEGHEPCRFTPTSAAPRLSGTAWQRRHRGPVIGPAGAAGSLPSTLHSRSARRTTGGTL